MRGKPFWGGREEGRKPRAGCSTSSESASGMDAAVALPALEGAACKHSLELHLSGAAACSWLCSSSRPPLLCSFFRVARASACKRNRRWDERPCTPCCFREKAARRVTLVWRIQEPRQDSHLLLHWISLTAPGDHVTSGPQTQNRHRDVQLPESP